MSSKFAVLAPAMRPRFVAVASLVFCIALGDEYARIARDVFFLKTVGAEMMPYMYMATAGAVVLVSIFYGLVITKLPEDRVEMGFLALVATTAVGMWLAVTYTPADSPRAPAVAYAVYCAVTVLTQFGLIHFWNYANKLFSPNEGKSAFAAIGAFAILGTVIAGATTPLIAEYWHPKNMLVLWALMATSAIARASAVRRVAKLKTTSDDAEEGNPSLRKVWRQPLIRTLTYMALPLWVIIFIIEFYYYQTMDRVFSQPDELATFLGMFTCVASITGFLLQFSVTPALLKRVGVGATSVVYPIFLALGTIALLGFSLLPVAAEGGPLPLTGVALLVLLARFIDISMFFSIHETAQQLLFYAIRARDREVARTFVSGGILPLGTALAGGSLIVFEMLGEPIYNVTFLALTLAFVLVVLALNLTPDYIKARVENTDCAAAAPRAELEQEIDRLAPMDVHYVLMQSLISDNKPEALFAATKLVQLHDQEMLEDIEELMDELDADVLATFMGELAQEDLDAHPEFVANAERALKKAA